MVMVASLVVMLLAMPMVAMAEIMSAALVDWQDVGSIITASYATGNADGGAGSSDSVGGLVG